LATTSVNRPQSETRRYDKGKTSDLWVPTQYNEKKTKKATSSGLDGMDLCTKKRLLGG